MDKFSAENFFKIREKIQDSFKDAGYPPEIMYAIFSTLITEYFFLNGSTLEDLEEYFNVTRQAFISFKDEC